MSGGPSGENLGVLHLAWPGPVFGPLSPIFETQQGLDLRKLDLDSNYFCEDTHVLCPVSRGAREPVGFLPWGPQNGDS